MKNILKTVAFIIALLTILVIIDFRFISDVPKLENCTKYECNVKAFSLRTSIRISKNKEEIASIKGKTFWFFTDPLTMYNCNGEEIAYGDDTYHIIAQDSHTIYVDGNPVIEMIGNFSIFGNKYDIYDISTGTATKIATTEFNAFNTYGCIKGTDGKIWADYSSSLFLRDYTVRVKSEYCKLDESTLLMIMASFYSDWSADSSK